MKGTPKRWSITAGVEFPLDLPAEIGHVKTADEIDKCCKDISFCRKAHPFRVTEGGLGGPQKVVEGDDHHQGGILECRYQHAYRGGDHDFQRLGQNDEAHGLVVVEPQGFGCLDSDSFQALPKEYSLVVPARQAYSH